jgi:hypothetical protein
MPILIEDNGKRRAISKAEARRLCRQKMKTGKTPAEEKVEEERMELLTSLTAALRVIAEIGVPPQQYVDLLPDERATPPRWYDRTVGELWEKAWPWLEEFNRLWTELGGSQFRREDHP